MKEIITPPSDEIPPCDKRKNENPKMAFIKEYWGTKNHNTNTSQGGSLLNQKMVRGVRKYLDLIQACVDI